MRIAFVRHGAHVDDQLTAGGREMALEAGRFLAEQGFAPAVVVTTRSSRTQQTAELLLERCGGSPRRVVRQGLPGTAAGWRKLLAELPVSGDVVLVGHHPTQRFIESQLGGKVVAVPKDNRGAVFVLHLRDEDWFCVALSPGAAP